MVPKVEKDNAQNTQTISVTATGKRSASGVCLPMGPETRPSILADKSYAERTGDEYTRRYVLERTGDE